MIFIRHDGQLKQVRSFLDEIYTKQNIFLKTGLVAKCYVIKQKIALQGPDMLNESRLYSFIDQQLGFSIHFLEGQRLVHDLALIHNLKGAAFLSLRNTILSAQHLMTLLKPGESFGFYIDSDEPFIRFKLETSDEGYMRTLLIPEDLPGMPSHINGMVRLSKMSPHSMTPYNSVVELNNVPADQIVNRVLLESFQTPSFVKVSDLVDQSVMIMKLPRPNVNKEESIIRESAQEYWLKIQKYFHAIFQNNLTEQNSIENALKDSGLLLIGSKQVKFQCACSRERMVMGIAGLVRSGGFEQAFLPHEQSCETKCDYCRTYYQITKKEIEDFLK